jgi:ABC-type uncharacterized transport system substrate-binding protein
VLIHGAAGGVGSALLQLGLLAGLEMYGTCSSRGALAVSDLGGVPIDYHHLVADLSHGPSLRETEAAGRTLGLQLQPRVDVSNPATLAGAFATVTKEGSTAVFTIGGTMLYANRRQLAEMALKSRLPMACASPEFVSSGCLMTYSASLADIFRRSAGYVDRILRGAKPAELPIEQPTKFELVINLKTAKALGLTIPASVLARADQVID